MPNAPYSNPYAIPRRSPSAQVSGQTRYRNLSQPQQGRVNQQVQAKNYGSGALGQIAQRRASAIPMQQPATARRATSANNIALPSEIDSKTGYRRLPYEKQVIVDRYVTDPAKLAEAKTARPNKPLVQIALRRLENQGGRLPETIESVVNQVYGTIQGGPQSSTEISRQTSTTPGIAGHAGEHNPPMSPTQPGAPKESNNLRGYLDSRPKVAANVAKLTPTQKAEFRRLWRESPQSARRWMRETLGLIPSKGEEDESGA